VEEAVVRNLAASPRPPKTIVLQMALRLQLTVILVHQAGYPGTAAWPEFVFGRCRE